MNSIGVGMIGSGFMGLTYSQCLKAHVEGAHLVATTGGTRAEKLAADFEVPVEQSVESLLARADIDAVILATPDQHRLGGYETWLGTNYVEKDASTKIVNMLLELFAQLKKEDS